jgi:Uma2 family endonuclease
MVAIPKPPYITPQQYLEQEQTAEVRSEYWNGEIVAIAGGTRNHNQIIRNLNRRLGNLLEGSPCKPFSSETGVRVSDCNTYFYPDAIIVCGEAEYEETEAETLLNPTVILEVLSPSTEAADRGRKFACYRTLASLQYYLLIEPDMPAIDLYTREANGIWQFSTLTGLDAILTLDRLGIALPLTEIYQAVEFTSETFPLRIEETRGDSATETSP